MRQSLDEIKARFFGVRAQLPYLPRALSLVWSASRSLAGIRVALLVVQGLLPVVMVYLTRVLVNDLVTAVRSAADWRQMRAALVTAIVLGCVMLIAELLRSLSNWVCTAQAEEVKDHISELIQEKSASVDLAFYETPDFYDHLHRARADAADRPILLMESMGSLFQNGVTLAGMAAVLIPYGAWLPFVLLVSTLPVLYVVLRSTVRHQRWYQRATVEERRAWYYDYILTAGETAPEVRLLDTGEHFRSAYKSLRRRLRSELLTLKRVQGFHELAAGAIAFGITGCVMALMVWRALRGLISLGDLALFYQAFSQGQLLFRSLLQSTGQIYANILFLGDLFEFLSLRPRVEGPPRPLPAPHALAEGIRFNRVCFQYPGSGRAALDDFDLVIPAGQFAAIVGANGAGKSTLIKLLCRLYDPDQGRIELDSTDIRSFAVADLRRQMSVLFQVPVHYNATVHENIALGDLAAAPGGAEIEAAARASGAGDFIAGLPQRYENMLGRWLEPGAELSVGEWQKVALARALVRKSPIVLLDEPTSAMDPWAEAEWLERFRKHTAGRTSLLITHRMTTAMFADVIHLLANGHIVESGTHSQLLAKDGLYARSWARQMDACA